MLIAVNQDIAQLGMDRVLLASLLIVINALISLTLKLRMEGSLLLASLRTAAQLWLVALVLHWVFDIDRWYVVCLLGAIMTGIILAGRTGAAFAVDDVGERFQLSLGLCVHVRCS